MKSGLVLGLCCHKKIKERRRKAAPETPAKGHQRTAPGRRSLSGALVQALLRWFKSLMAQVGCFTGSNYLTLARHFKLYSVIGYLPVADSP